MSCPIPRGVIYRDEKKPGEGQWVVIHGSCSGFKMVT